MNSGENVHSFTIYLYTINSEIYTMDLEIKFCAPYKGAEDNP